MKAILVMIGMVLVIIATGFVQTMHENQMVRDAEIQQQQKIVDQGGNKAKANTQWKLDHHNGEIPAYKD